MLSQPQPVLPLRDLYDHYHHTLEDFWGRRDGEARYWRDFHVFGRAVQLASNDEEVLAAVAHSLPLFAQVPAAGLPPFSIQITVQPAPRSLGPAPDNLMAQVWYAGAGAWVTIQLGSWGHAHVDLAGGQAHGVLSRELAQRPDLVSQCLLNTILLNFCLSAGYGLLHASCLYRDGRALLLLAPHNTGKSTTALHLMRAGYRLVTDSMIHVPPHSDTLLLAGFPINKIKLRADMVPLFPEFQPYLTTELVREETKYVLHLQGLNGYATDPAAIAPEKIELCLLRRNGSGTTSLTPAAARDVWPAVMANSLFYDDAPAWERNLTQISRVIERARLHHLDIGHEPAGIVAAINRLWTR